MDLDGGCDQQLSDDHQKFMTHTGELSSTLDNQPSQRYGWCSPKFKWLTWLNHAPFRMVCRPWATSTC